MPRLQEVVKEHSNGFLGSRLPLAAKGRPHLWVPVFCVYSWVCFHTSSPPMRAPHPVYRVKEAGGLWGSRLRRNLASGELDKNHMGGPSAPTQASVSLVTGTLSPL